MPTFIDMSALTLKSSASGQEEIQVSESNKINTSQIAALAPSQQLTGFTALTAGKPAITANTTLLAAIQSLYAMVGSGKVKIISDGADQTGMVCWNGTSASGFVINVNEAAIYTRSQWTQSNPDSVTDANWIAAVKTGGTKNPFNALNTLLTGWINRTTQKPTITSANTIFDALKALYWASGNGNVLNISNGENRFGFVGWNANTAYGFMVDTANFTIYIRQWAQAQATSNANTTALWREAIQGGEAFSLKQPLNIYIHPGTSSVPLADLATVKEADVFIYTVGDNRASFLKSELYDNEVVFNSVTALASEWSDRSNPPEVHFMSIKINLTTGDLTPDVVPVFLPSWLKIEGTPIQVSDFKTIIDLDKFKGMRDGELVGFFSSSGGGASGPGVNPVLGYIQRASASQANILAYNMGATKAWIGYATSAATKWTELGGGGNVLHGNDITEGLEYLVPENVGDVVAFRSTMDSAQVPAEQEGFGFLAKVNGSESMAMMMQNDPAGGGKMKFFMGRVQNDGSGTDWQELTAGGMETLWTPTEATYVMVDTDVGNGDPVQINLTRALKATDRVLITWRKQNTSYLGIDVTGQAIINPNAYEHDVFLELVENFVTPSEYYGLSLDQSTTEAGSEALLFSASSWGGSTYGPQYLITGIYNISGK